MPSDSQASASVGASARAASSTPSDLAVVVQDAFVATLRERGSDLAADRLSLLDADQAWEAYFGPLADVMEQNLGGGVPRARPTRER